MKVILIKIIQLRKKKILKRANSSNNGIPCRTILSHVDRRQKTSDDLLASARVLVFTKVNGVHTPAGSFLPYCIIFIFEINI